MQDEHPGRILVTGGGGRLARALGALDRRIEAPPRDRLDVSDDTSLRRYCGKRKIDVLIHAAAETRPVDRDGGIGYVRDNILGTANVVLWCMRRGIRLVYLSTDYVYPGERGDYTEASVLFPVNRYAKSKLGGEMAVQLHRDSLVIRTSFYQALSFPRACTDQFHSRIPLKAAARAVLALALRRDLRGVINLGSPVKRSLYALARRASPGAVRPCLRRDLALPYRLPPDCSLDTAMYRRHFPEERPSARTKRCRVCASPALSPYLDLGRVPLANAYLRKEDLPRREFKEALALQLCRRCGLSQLTRVVPPERMFRNYLYRSSTPETFRAHCADLARQAVLRARARRGDLVLDIASNDGCLLSRFQAIGMAVVGVDPAENLASDADRAGIPTLCAYWSKAVAQDLAGRFGQPRIVTSQNVLGHVDDVHAFAEAVDRCLAPRGLWVIEVPYLLDFIRRNEFDTAYHEHLSYFSLHPLFALLATHGFQASDVQYFPRMHGGTIRVFAGRRGETTVHPRVGAFLARERAFGLRTLAPYRAFASRVHLNQERLVGLLRHLRREGRVVWAYGAGAKGNILVNACGITRDLVPVAVDDNPGKWGYYTPGAQMRIAPIRDLAGTRVDHLLLLAWNFEEEILKRCAAAGYRGAYIVPVPEVHVLKPATQERSA